MSSFFKPKDYKDYEDYSKCTPAEPLPDGSYEPVLNDHDLRVASRRMHIIDTAPYSYATQNAPAAMYASYYALRKIYAGDEDAFNAAILNQLDCVFNATPPVCGLLLGAGLAIEDKGHEQGMSAENDLKVGLMGPLSGVGDVLIWILPPTILGAIAGYMAMQGNPTGVILWLVLWLALSVWRAQNYVQGYKVGASLITKMGNRLNALTDSASILGLTVAGSLIYSSVTISTPLTFTFGDVTLGLQEGVLDLIFPNLLAVLLAVVIYNLIKKGIKLNWVIVGVLVVSCVCSALGVLA